MEHNFRILIYNLTFSIPSNTCTEMNKNIMLCAVRNIQHKIRTYVKLELKRIEDKIYVCR